MQTPWELGACVNHLTVKWCHKVQLFVRTKTWQKIIIVFKALKAISYFLSHCTFG